MIDDGRDPCDTYPTEYKFSVGMPKVDNFFLAAEWVVENFEEDQYLWVWPNFHFRREEDRLLCSLKWL